MFPAIAETRRAEAVTRLLGRRRPWQHRTEITVEVFLAGQVSAPRGKTVGAIVDRAERSVTFRSLQQLAAGDRPAKCHRAIDVDAPRSLAFDRLPLTAPVLDLDHRNAVRVLRDAHVVERLGRRLAEHVRVAAELVVDRQHAAPITAAPAAVVIVVVIIIAAAERKISHAVMADTDLLRLVLGARRITVGRAAGLERLAPGDQHIELVILRYGGPRAGTIGNRDRFEPDQAIGSAAIVIAIVVVIALIVVVIGERGAGKSRHAHGGGGEAALEHGSALEVMLQDIFEGAVARLVADIIIVTHCV